MANYFGKRWVVLFFLLSLSFISSPVAASSTVNKIRYSVDFDHTRIVVDLSRPASYQIVAFTDPERVAINLKRTKVSGDLQPIGMSNGIVERVRLNKLSWGSQIVLDLREKATWKHFILDKSGVRPNRIVIDVFPERPIASSARTNGESRSEAASTGSTGSAAASSVDRSANTAGRTQRSYVVAVDAGHGGMDPGALGKYGIVEKNLVLDISRRIAREIDRHDGYRAVLTRTGDEYLTLPGRTQIAQEKGADIFISIHMNAAKNRKAQGAEVFFISPAGAADKISHLLSDKNLAENELGLAHGQSDEVLSLILDTNQQVMMHRSSLLAEKILAALSRADTPPTRGIKQRSFAVLKTIVMPSVLVEPGFISNSRDAKYLKSEKGQAEVARAIAAGIISYLEQYPPPSSQRREVIVHRVREGDTLWKISRMYGITVAGIQEANRLNRSTKLYVGQELVITK
jgi:N-acetylmuramoyl-L-alanine amidase